MDWRKNLSVLGVALALLASGQALANESGVANEQADPLTIDVLAKAQAAEQSQQSQQGEQDDLLFTEEVKYVKKVTQKKQPKKKGKKHLSVYQQVVFSDDYKTYTLVDGGSQADDDQQQEPQASEGQSFYIKSSKNKSSLVAIKFKKSFCLGWSDNKVCHDYRDGFLYAFTASSTSGDTLLPEFAERDEFKAYSSYRLQLFRLFYESPGLATRHRHGLYASRSWGVNIVNNELWALDLYKERDTKVLYELERIKPRNQHKRGGLRLSGYFDSSLLQVIYSPYSTAKQDDGVQGSISYSHFWPIQHWNVYTSLAAQYQSKEIDFDDSITSLQAPSTARVNYAAEMGFEYPLTKHWVLGGFVAYHKLPKSLVTLEQEATTKDMVGVRSGLSLSLVF